MRYIGIIILLVLCLTLLLFTGCRINTVETEPESVNFGNQEDINQNSNNSQSSSTGLVYESGTVYPQKWATGTGTIGDPWANDCIQEACDAVPAGGTVYLKAGYYILSAAVDVTKSVNIIGEGRNKTIIITADDFGFNITTDYVTLKGLTIDGDAQTPVYENICIINADDCDYILLEDIKVMNGGWYGINLYEVNHSLLQNIYAYNNYLGVHPGSDTAGRNAYNTCRDIYTWDNSDQGFYDRGCWVDPELQRNNIYDNIYAWGNTNNGIYVSYISGGSLINSSAHDNSLYGIYLNHVYNFTIENCSAYSNDESGDELAIYLLNCDNINLTSVIVKNNYTGIDLNGCSNIALTSCQSYDDRETPLQRFGLQLNGTNTDISLLNCKLSPNSLGEIYNPAGAVVTVITQKRGSFSFCPCEGVKRLKQSLLATFSKLKSKNYKLIYLTFPIFFCHCNSQLASYILKTCNS